MEFYERVVTFIEEGNSSMDVSLDVRDFWNSSVHVVRCCRLSGL